MQASSLDSTCERIGLPWMKALRMTLCETAKIDSRLARDSGAKDSRLLTGPGHNSGWRTCGVTERAYSDLLEAGFGANSGLPTTENVSHCAPHPNVNQRPAGWAIKRDHRVILAF
jgi:hypothetical protein